MKRDKIILIVVGAIILIAAVAAALYFSAHPDAWQQAMAEMELSTPQAEGIVASGFVEAEEVSIAPEVGGLIVEILVSEGDTVEAGQPLVQLNDTLAQAQLDLAQAGLEVAQARLAQVHAGARPEAIRRAEAELAQAEAARDGAYQGWQDTLALVDNPQELDAQIAQAEAQLAAAEAELRRAGLMRDMAQIANDAFTDALSEHPPGSTEQYTIASGSVADVLPGLPQELVDFISGMTDGTYTYNGYEITLSGGQLTVSKIITINYQMGMHLLPNAYWKSWVGVNTAQAAYDGAQQMLNLLYRIRNDPQELEAQVDAAEAQYHAAEAMVELAQAQLDGLRDGATAEEIAAVEAQVQQAQAQLDSARVLVDKLTLTAPASGQVLDVTAHNGELAVPGAPIVSLADLERVMLTVYVPEDQLGHVWIGQQVEVSVDSFPDRVFVGQVATIAHEAEFTPRNVQTQEERVNMVFAVKVVIPNPDHALKPGMPADAVILTEEQ